MFGIISQLEYLAQERFLPSDTNCHPQMKENTLIRNNPKTIKAQEYHDQETAETPVSR